MAFSERADFAGSDGADSSPCKQLDNNSAVGEYESAEWNALFREGGCIGCEALMNCAFLECSPIEQWAFYGHTPGKEKFFGDKITELNEKIKNEIDNMYQRCKEFAFKWSVAIYDGPNEDLKAFLSEMNDNIVNDIDYFIEDLIHERHIKEMKNKS